MALILALVSSLRCASLTWSRYLAISISILSEMPSYFSIREKSFTNLLSSFSSSSSLTMPNMRSMRSPKEWISFCASSTESSGVFMMVVPPIYLRRNSSSSSLFLFFMSLHTSFSICGMNHISTPVLVMLKHVWKAASTTGSFTVSC